MKALDVINGCRHGEPPGSGAAAAAAVAIRMAMQRGYRIGRLVNIGSIDGRVIGYNIAAYGRYVGADYPLLVATELGVAKCRPDELHLR
jgi:hypothetical protein